MKAQKRIKNNIRNQTTRKEQHDALSLTLENIAKRFLNCNDETVRIQRLNLNSPVSKFESRLVKKYFRNTNNNHPALCIKLFEKNGDEQNKGFTKCENNREDLLNCTFADKRRALSPKPQTVYFGVKNEAFFNKREGILKPDIKLKIVEMLFKRKSKIRQSKDVQIDSDGNITKNTKTIREEKNTVCTSPKGKESAINRFNPTILSMMAKYTKRFTGHIDCEIVTGRKHDGNNICNDGEVRNNNQATSSCKRKKFLSNIFESDKYISRINIIKTFDNFNNVIDEEEIEEYGKRIWKDAHRDSQ